MNRTNTLILWMALLFAAQPSYAELALDAKQKPQQVVKILKQKFESVVRPYSKQHAVDFGDSYGKFASFPNYEDSNFAWTFNGATFYSNITAFVPEIVPLEDCKPNEDTALPTIHCDWRRTRYYVCHLFMFNGKDLKLESVSRLNILRDRKQLVGLPMCFGPQAMAVAKIIPDAMLITLSYVDSAEPADPRNLPPEFYTTVLLRFSNENGKLKIEQDDSCLGNPNNYKTIAAARKALTKCAVVQK